MNHTRLIALSLLTVIGAAALAGCSPSGTSSETADKIPVLAPDDRITRGPNGEASEPASSIQLSDDDIATVKAGGYTAALIWDAQTTWFDAVSQGAQAAFADYGIQVIAQTQYNFDVAKQKEQVETVMALDPDVILTIADDPVLSGEALKPAVDAGVKIVLLSTAVKDWTAGDQFVGMVTGDQAGMGAAAADALAQAIPDDAEVGLLYHDANYFVTNRRDQMVKTTLVDDYPALKIVSEQGFASPDQAEALTSAMFVQHPDIAGLYGAWDAVTQSALAALNAAGRNDVKVVTMDLGVGTAVNMASGGQIIAIISEQTYQLGQTMAAEAVLGLLGKDAPPFVVVPAVTVTKDNIVEKWKELLRTDPPKEVLDALNK